MLVAPYAQCDIGLIRETNEDSVLVNPSLGLYAVCDGMGGHAAGEVASSTAAALLEDYFRDRGAILTEADCRPDGYFRILRLAEEAVQQVSAQLYEMACCNPDCRGMGTTLTMLLVVNNKAIVAHVGDSRLYLLRDGDVHLLSSDHTMANELVQLGHLEADRAKHSRFASVLTRSVGRQELVQVDTLLFDLLPGDTCLLCSDGFSKYLDETRELRDLLNAEDPQGVPQRLVDLATSRGGGDNISVIVLRVDETDDSGVANAVNRKLELLERLPLFAGLSLNRLLQVLNICEERTCEAGWKVAVRGEPLPGLHVLTDGRLWVCGETGEEAELLSGCCFGEGSLFSRRTAAATVTAREDSKLLLIPRRDFAALTRRCPKLGVRILSRIGVHLTNRLDDPLHETASARNAPWV
jgi:serine/threonine protein phosphatase PrpC